MRVLRKEARELLAWCLEQRGPFTRSQCAKAMSRHLESVRDVLERFVERGLLDVEKDYTGHYSYMVRDRQAAIEATQQEAKRGYWLEAQRRARIKQAAPRRMVNSVWSLAA